MCQFGTQPAGSQLSVGQCRPLRLDSLAILAPIRRASSFVSSFATDFVVNHSVSRECCQSRPGPHSWFTGGGLTVLSTVQKGPIWRVRIAWPIGAVHYFGEIHFRERCSRLDHRSSVADRAASRRVE